MTHSHAELVVLGEKWLKRQNCGVVFRDAFRASTTHGEQPDAIGWRHNISILVECKASRADFLADRAKTFRAEPAKGIGDWRFYLCQKDLILESELPSGWGLLYADGSRVRPVAGFPGNCNWGKNRPFIGEKECEIQMLYAALRRMVVRGHFDAIYDPIATTHPVQALQAENGEG